MDKAKAKRLIKDARHERVRKKVSGTSGQPRLSVCRSLKHIQAQLIDDVKGVTLAHASSVQSDFKAKSSRGNNISAAKLVGEMIAQKALESGYKRVVFDRGGFVYHGRVKALAEAAREKGLQF